MLRPAAPHGKQTAYDDARRLTPQWDRLRNSARGLFWRLIGAYWRSGSNRSLVCSCELKGKLQYFQVSVVDAARVHVGTIITFASWPTEARFGNVE